MLGTSDVRAANAIFAWSRFGMCQLDVNIEGAPPALCQPLSPETLTPDGEHVLGASDVRARPTSSSPGRALASASWTSSSRVRRLLLLSCMPCMG